ncbi:uncharacterized protein LOC123298130 isoform X2 [Chrysoperla carnea]|uniref:uncharacterized protein LOC123298130 isoform X2 n=1 Tax=Chrysoperla carnea TaxID=189513 RepID=UPI001D07D7B0|nr:uncharacterized protein LOC123298130 isoform X2 [Chrysoperla carnea]
MGTCLGRCLHRSNSGNMRHRSGSNRTFRHDDSIEFFHLVDSSEKKPVLELAEDLWCPLGDPHYSRLHKSASVQSRPSQSTSAGDISLQCLDARSLLTSGAGREQSVLSSSTPPSSIDLEWEHEGYPSPAPWKVLPEEDDFLHFDSSSQNSQVTIATPAQQKKCPSEITHLSGWSQISTPDSLEWDPVQTALQDSSELPVSDLDAETEQLLCEIERLTKKALKETGRDLDR